MIRNWVAAIAVVVAAGAAATVSAASTSTACKSSQLKTTRSSVQAGLGHRVIVLMFKNKGVACTLHGYPGADLQSAKFKRLVSAKRTRSGYFGGLKPGEKPPFVHLRKGQTASAIVEWVVLSGPLGACVHAKYLVVTPPNTSRSVRFAPADFKIEPVCALSIHPVVPGKSGQG
jgi:hypothetical protein